MFRVSVKLHQHAQYIAYGGCRGNNIFGFIPSGAVARNCRSTCRENLEAVVVLSYIAKVVDKVMAVGPSAIEIARLHQFFINPIAAMCKAMVSNV